LEGKIMLETDPGGLPGTMFSAQGVAIKRIPWQPGDILLTLGRLRLLLGKKLFLPAKLKK